MRPAPVSMLSSLQVTPPFVVTRVAAYVTTAHPCSASVKVTPRRSKMVAEVCVLQLAPPSVVARMAPPLPAPPAGT